MALRINSSIFPDTFSDSGSKPKSYVPSLNSMTPSRSPSRLSVMRNGPMTATSSSSSRLAKDNDLSPDTRCVLKSKQANKKDYKYSLVSSSWVFLYQFLLKNVKNIYISLRYDEIVSFIIFSTKIFRLVSNR